MPALKPYPFLIAIIAGSSTADKADPTIGSMPWILDFRRLASAHLIDIRLDFSKMIGINIVKPGMKHVLFRYTIPKTKQFKHGLVCRHPRSASFVYFDSPQPNAKTIKIIGRQSFRVFISHK